MNPRGESFVMRKMTALKIRNDSFTKTKNSLKSKNLCIILTFPIKSLETPPVTSSYQKNEGNGIDA